MRDFDLTNDDPGQNHNVEYQPRTNRENLYQPLHAPTLSKNYDN